MVRESQEGVSEVVVEFHAVVVDDVEFTIADAVQEDGQRVAADAAALLVDGDLFRIVPSFDEEVGRGETRGSAADDGDGVGGRIRARQVSNTGRGGGHDVGLNHSRVRYAPRVVRPWYERLLRCT